MLDYLSDFVACLYGSPGIYGVVTMPFGVREGINVFLDGFIPTENMRFRYLFKILNFLSIFFFRNSSLSFKVIEQLEHDVAERNARYSYPDMSKTHPGFKLNVKQGEFTDSEIIVLLGENGTGKTTFIKFTFEKL